MHFTRSLFCVIFVNYHLIVSLDADGGSAQIQRNERTVCTGSTSEMRTVGGELCFLAAIVMDSFRLIRSQQLLDPAGTEDGTEGEGEGGRGEMMSIGCSAESLARDRTAAASAGGRGEMMSIGCSAESLARDRTAESLARDRTAESLARDRTAESLARDRTAESLARDRTAESLARDRTAESLARDRTAESLARDRTTAASAASTTIAAGPMPVLWFTCMVGKRSTLKALLYLLCGPREQTSAASATFSSANDTTPSTTTTSTTSATGPVINHGKRVRSEVGCEGGVVSEQGELEHTEHQIKQKRRLDTSANPSKALWGKDPPHSEYHDSAGAYSSHAISYARDFGDNAAAAAADDDDDNNDDDGKQYNGTNTSDKEVCVDAEQVPVTAPMKPSTKVSPAFLAADGSSPAFLPRSQVFTTVFSQGLTRRWGLAWTFCPRAAQLYAAFLAHKKQQKQQQQQQQQQQSKAWPPSKCSSSTGTTVAAKPEVVCKVTCTAAHLFDTQLSTEIRPSMPLADSNLIQTEGSAKCGSLGRSSEGTGGIGETGETGDSSWGKSRCSTVVEKMALSRARQVITDFQQQHQKHQKQQKGSRELQLVGPPTLLAGSYSAQEGSNSTANTACMNIKSTFMVTFSTAEDAAGDAAGAGAGNGGASSSAACCDLSSADTLVGDMELGIVVKLTQKDDAGASTDNHSGDITVTVTISK